MSKQRFVAIEVAFNYDPDHPDDLTDIVQVRQTYSNLPADEAHEQASFLWADQPWRETFTDAIINALTGAPTHFGSEDN